MCARRSSSATATAPSPRRRACVEGSSVGYTDRYPAFYEGQSLDLTGVPAGRYTVVNRVNPYLRFRELRYDNDAASVAMRISWPHGPGQAPSGAGPAPVSGPGR